MKPEEINTFAQCCAVLEYVNERLHTTFSLRQWRGKDFERMELRTDRGVVLMDTLLVMDKVCVGLLALAKEMEV